MDTKRTPYLPGDRLRDLVDDNNLLLLVISRFAIPLGFGDGTVRDICHSCGVDCDTFLTVANLISGREHSPHDISLSSLMVYLENAHSYFLDFILPTIREKLIKAIDCSDSNDVGFLILRYFDNYVLEVRRHMEYENDTVFPYIREMIAGRLPEHEFSLRDYSQNHDSVTEKLQELKDIVIRHYKHRNNNMLNYVLYDIINCGGDLGSHSEVEDVLFLPQAIKLEKKLGTRPAASECSETESSIDDAQPDATLSSREREIIACVAKGMSNKEIAEALCLSIHTVTTHRRNIASKLQIHSPAGLTIYAILNKLIDIKEIKLQ
ncbi:MAG: LuxR C-terminal-related transcriptional regulator [Muribaculaceae bacterium]|nr:LuxR C-terminal-related transcriptional regulator [Muribaculaceae bacterium]